MAIEEFDFGVASETTDVDPHDVRNHLVDERHREPDHTASAGVAIGHHPHGFGERLVIYHLLDLLAREAFEVALVEEHLGGRVLASDRRGHDGLVCRAAG